MKQPLRARGWRLRRTILRLAPCAFAACWIAGCAVGGDSTAPADPQSQLDPGGGDDGSLVPLPGNTHFAAQLENSLGPLSDDFLLEHLQLVLKRSPERDAALVTHIDALHDKTSPLYQHWLTAKDFGDQYGVSPSDVAVVEHWLEGYGFHIDGVPPSRMFIEFTGTAAQVKAAFHTQIDRLTVGGELHFANMSDPKIPVQLAKVVAGVHALHDFLPHSMRKERGHVRRNHATGKWQITKPAPGFDLPNVGACLTNADCTSGTCNTATGACACTSNTQCPALLGGGAAQCSATTHACVTCLSNADCSGPATCNTAAQTCEETYYAVAPADFATIYNLNPLFAAGLTGAGQTVVVLEDTFLANPSDVTTFWSAFGLSGFHGTFTQTTVAGAAACTNPGVNGDEGEAALDAEWAGVSAPAANIVLAACANGPGTSSTAFGGYLALENLVNGASPPAIVSMSYGECESANGAAANLAYSQLYQQAASEGTSVFVSAGDEGAASCDANKTVATHGIAVSGFASTPYNVAVGGTDFGDYYLSQRGGPAESTYWSPSNTSTFGSALSYIPEIPWNDSCSSQAIYGTPALALGTYTQAYGATGFCNSTFGKNFFRTTAAGSGGPSNAASGAGGWPQPSWQTGVFGLPTKSGGVRYLPDVSLFAANGVFGHFLVYCLTDAAQGGGPCTYTNEADSLALAAGGTSFASPALAGIQALINQKMGGPQGNPNYTYYKLAAAEQGAHGSTRCNGSSGLPAPECVFNDVTQGDIDVDCRGINCFGSVGTTVFGSLSPSTTAYSPAYAAGTGWDYATGLGTVNAYNLVQAWSK